MKVPSNDEEFRTFQLLREVKTAALSAKQVSQLHRAESTSADKQASILVVDDSAALREIIVLMLGSLGYRRVTEAVDGQDALERMQRAEFDLIVLDIEMPRMNGYEVLSTLRDDPVFRHVPVIVASGLSDLEAVAKCIDLGAEDFLLKPVNLVILRARVASSLERKRLRDLEQLRLIELHQEKLLLAVEQEKSERLLLNILPISIAHRLKQGERTIAERHEDVTVLFADLVGFTALVKTTGPVELVELLNDLFSRFDRMAGRLGLEKIKTIGDCYLVVGGLPEPLPNHAILVADMASEMLNALAEFNRERGLKLKLRLGMHTGPVVAGVIGHQKFAYDLWGATVNLASRLQTSGLPNRIHLSAATAELLRGKYHVTAVRDIVCKGIGRVHTCLLEGRI